MLLIGAKGYLIDTMRILLLIYYIRKHESMNIFSLQNLKSKYKNNAV